MTVTTVIVVNYTTNYTMIMTIIILHSSWSLWFTVVNVVNCGLAGSSGRGSQV